MTDDRLSEVLVFKAPVYLVQAIKAEAARLMMSESALMRQAVAQRLGLLETQPGQAPTPPPAEVVQCD